MMAADGGRADRLLKLNIRKLWKLEVNDNSDSCAERHTNYVSNYV